MKYWQKTFLAALLLFLAALNAGAYLLFNTAYQTALASERERSFFEHSFIGDSLDQDITAVAARSGDLSAAVWSDLFQSYAEYYYTQGIYIAIRDNSVHAYTNVPQLSSAPDTPAAGVQTAKISGVDGVPYLYVSGQIGDSGYSLVTARSVSAMQARADVLARTLVWGSLCISVLLSVALFFILKQLTLPIKKLSAAASALADGDYGIRAAAHGHDELSDLARRFNIMADQIQSQILELTQEAENKQRFIDDMAHEMRTPLTAISGYTQYLTEAAITEDERLSALVFISRESKRLADLSEKLLMLARLRNTSAACEPVSMKRLFDDLRAAAAHPASNHRVSLHFIIEDAVWQSDETLLYMLFLNVIQNAVQACGDGGDVTVSANRSGAQIRDNGCGMDPASLAHVTEPFYRADKSRSRAAGGTGLGLSICESICKCLNLSMNIESALNGGTTVKVLQVDDNSKTA